MTYGTVAARRAHAGVSTPGFLAVRLLLAAALSLYVVSALGAPELPAPAKAAALALSCVTAFHALGGLLTLTALAPLGLLLAPAPMLVAELLGCAFLVGWLVAVWRPLGLSQIPRAVRWLATLYAVTVLGSWLALVLSSGAGIDAPLLPLFVLQSIPLDYFVFSSPAAAGRVAAQTVAGIAVFLAAAAIGRTHVRVPAAAAGTLAASCGAIAALNLVQMLREWASTGFAERYLLRFVQGTRFSAHMPDFNAAGSLYVLGGLVAAALMLLASRRRVLWGGVVLLTLPALAISGSRAATAGAITVGGLILHLSQRGQRLTHRQKLAIGTIAAVAVAAVVITLASQVEGKGTTSGSLRMRGQFLTTSARMIASAPIFGVGIGQYLPRSPEFMPPELHAVYPAENAHNYFVQQVAELGLVGGPLFIALIGVGLGNGWRAMQQENTAPVVGLLSGTAGYLLTCVTGHPLLVPEAALPFWAAFGVVSALPSQSETPRPTPALTRGVAVALAVLLVVLVGRSVVAYRAGVGLGVERGTHLPERGDDGVLYRWSTEHAVVWVPPEPGFLTVPLRAPDFLERKRPFVAEIFADGHPIARREVPSGQWLRISVGLPGRSANAKRRIDLRVNQWWTANRDRGPRFTDTRPMSVMLGEVRLEQLAARPK